MPSTAERKEAARKWKERKPIAGAFAVRCTVTGRTWVGAARNLEATHNGCWFGLRIGTHLNRALQAEWNAQGEPAFQFEILEKLDDDVLPLAIPDMLKEKHAHWVAELGALPF